MLESMRHESLVHYLKNLQACKLASRGPQYPPVKYEPPLQRPTPTPSVPIMPAFAAHPSLQHPQPFVPVPHALAPPSHRHIHRIESIDNMERAGLVSHMECAAYLLMHMAAMKQMKQSSSYQNLSGMDQSANCIY